MSRDGSNIYSAPAGTLAVSGTTIESAKYNALVNDLVADANLPRPIVAGGTGATTAGAALVNFGLTATAAELNTLDGITATVAELNVLDGIPGTLTATEIGYLDGVTSAIQTQLNAKQATITTLPLANGGTGVALADPGADRLMFWDDSAGAMAFLTPGTGLTITGTTIEASQGRVLLATKTASASATLDFTEFNNATYRRYEFELDNVKPATDATDFEALVSSNAGSSYDTGASDYSWTYDGTGDAVLTGQDQADSAMRVATNVGNATEEDGISGNIMLFNAASATARTKLRSAMLYDAATGVNFQINGGGKRLADQDTDALRFRFSSGNIASGTIRMYGVV